MTLQDIEAATLKALELAQALAPIARLAGPAGVAAADAIDVLADLGETLIAEVGPDVGVIAGGHLAEIQALQAALQKENATLAGAVANS